MRAFHWLDVAVQGGSPLAAYNLAIRYWNGDGVPTNQAMAIELLEKAAAVVGPKSHADLGWINAQDPSDSARVSIALFHYFLSAKLAAAQGFDQLAASSHRYAHALTHLLSPNDVIKAYRDAESWKPPNNFVSH